ncbi:hypothetical protein FEM48_Zijuj09G0034500 [Ziziphus jujuba var. spinosa]|uniref:Uncharacterized protein n=1 Tax=Ziziphus jujuba var. spinosa TaxID=714518 RepID=A0A978UQM5_ZIZJJ|nr:hypothetical protein FEM48_Zijuj09G0034500 [Ziziphus jujuba var. spinosa]
MAMNKKNSTPNSLGVCEKIFNVIRVGPAIQKIRRISYCPRDSAPHAGGKIIEIRGEDADADHGYQEPATKIQVLPTPNNHQKVISSATKVGQEDGRLAISVSFKEKTPKPNKAQPEKVVLVGQSQGLAAGAAKVGSKVEPQGQTHKRGVVFSQEQSSHGGREVKFVTKGDEKNLTKSKGHGKPASDDQDRRQGINERNKKQGVDHLNDAFSDYINRKKIEIRSELDDGKNTWDLLDGVRHDGNKKDSLKDHFSDYIHRAKNKMARSSSSFGTGKNVSFKKE